ILADEEVVVLDERGPLAVGGARRGASPWLPDLERDEPLGVRRRAIGEGRLEPLPLISAGGRRGVRFRRRRLRLGACVTAQIALPGDGADLEADRFSPIEELDGVEGELVGGLGVAGGLGESVGELLVIEGVAALTLLGIDENELARAA